MNPEAPRPIPEAVLLLLVLLATALGCSSDPPAPSHQGPPSPLNVLLVSVDTLRSDHLGVYGYPRPTSPQLDLFASTATIFERAQAPRALTWPSLTTLLTGREVHRHGVRRNGDRPTEPLRTLATALSEQGYATGAFLSNACEAELPGFDERFCSLSDEDKHYRWDRRATDEAVAFVQGATEPFLAWVHLMDPHWPYNCTPPTRPLFDSDYGGSLAVTRESLLAVTERQEALSREDQQHVENLYDCQVRHVDDRFGELLRALDLSGRMGRTIVVFTADHGEELGDHWLYYYHTASVYQSCLAVPMLIRLPSLASTSRRVGELVGLVDLAPTLIELLGLPAASLGQEIEGRSFAGLIEGRGGFEQEVVRGEIEDQVVVLRSPRYKYVWNPHGYAVPLEPGEREEGVSLAPALEELYDLRVDPEESRNLASELPEAIGRFRALAEALVGESSWTYRPSIIDPELRERLHALGYAGPGDS